MSVVARQAAAFGRPIQVYNGCEAAAVVTPISLCHKSNQVQSMATFSARITLSLVFTVLLGIRLVIAGEASSTDYSLGDSVPLDESELREITLQVLEKNPLLSSSPGIKHAAAQRSVRSVDIANVIYYPHAESAGIKQAFQVQCRRQMPVTSWTCGDAEIRRYLQLDSQDFEVRVTDGIEYEESLALIQATRRTVQASAIDGSVIPETAIFIWREHNTYLVNWGSPEGYTELVVEAHLRDDGNPAEPDDWQTSIFQPND